MNWIDKLDRKFGRHAISHLMYGISAVMLLVYFANLLTRGAVYQLLAFNRSLIFSGQIWRAITFLILPPNNSPIWILFSLYFYCLIGNGLEQEWGSFRFNLFYLIGALGAIISGFLTGYAVNDYLNFSMFLAFAAIYPNFQILVFFVLPVQVKYLAILDVIFYAFSFISGTFSTRIAILMALLNVILFFGSDFYHHLKGESGYRQTRNNWRNFYRQ